MKFWYILLIIIEHIVNILAIGFVSNFFAYHEAIPLAIYLLSIGFALKWAPYKFVSLYRLNFTYFVGASIQTILLVRNVLIQAAVQ